MWKQDFVDVALSPRLIHCFKKKRGVKTKI